MSAPDSGTAEPVEPAAPKTPVSPHVLRFQLSERQMHWAVAVPFMVCYATAVVLMGIYNPNPQRPFRALVSWTHRLSGLCLAALPLWTIARHWSEVALHKGNIREAWRWTIDDVKWLFLMGPATVSSRVSLPEQGKFNAAEKINFMVLTATAPLYLITGLLIWSHQYAFPAWIVHLSLAAIATPLLFGHVFMATVNPDTRVGLSGMLTGFVDRHWASHHYGRWYRENFAGDVVMTASTPAEPAPLAKDQEEWSPTRVPRPVDGAPARHRPTWPPVAVREPDGSA